ncbi:aspartate aminotransferase family protein [Acidiluteibacter ferrifornacis]|uniref:Aminotransferase class III-fold pyridoxal phosphate-dependent enzyme n=1 Tax=Acidiluteibacter ferrifornacis TaxID=2692424 RepID=A0A6N9NLL6_9FLAO|nr:aspartate aminotransferase family protein [Acidiluteibacter ferrifornacis]NBG65465.1 aminotransferase class III-fold pyridoxal phosphate-dependent enzyme [Acidiluteibacter ferrifornacis]
MSNSKEIFYKNLAQTTPFALGYEISHAEGSTIYTTDGRAILDFISGIGVSSLGHGHPAIKKAVIDQVEKHMHVMVYGEFIQESQSKLGEELSRVLPQEIDSYYFVNSGTEAIEGALKLAKRATGRQQIIAFERAYHGSTHGALSVGGNKAKQTPFLPLLPNIDRIQLNNLSDLEKITTETACVILETIQGDAGVRIPDYHYMQALRKRCSEVGTLLILDEIQSGIGRTGKFLAFEHFDIVPDIITMGKALGGGMPIGCFASRKELMEQLSDHPMLGHITTFGGHPVVCAAAAAGLKVLREENLIAGVQAKADKIASLLVHPCIKEVRYKGLMIAVDLDSEERVQKVVDDCLKNGLLTFWFLSTAYSFRLAPPLNISEEDLEKGCAIILAAIEKTAN